MKRIISIIIALTMALSMMPLSVMATDSGVTDEYNEVESAFIFGSRAKGTYKRGSDVDIAIKGEKITIDVVAKILNELEEETILPYFFDVVHYDTCSTNELVEHIDRLGVCIYMK